MTGSVARRLPVWGSFSALTGARVALVAPSAASAGPTAGHVVLAVHGGTGSDLVTRSTAPGYRRALTRAPVAGGRTLAAGATSVDAVEAAVEVLEDDPRFNAGRGAVFNTDGHIELDAAIVDGRDRDAGALAGIRNLDRRGRPATPHSSTGLIDADLTASGRIVIRFEGR